MCVSECEGVCGCLKTGKIERLLDFCKAEKRKRGRERACVRKSVSECVRET